MPVKFLISGLSRFDISICYSFKGKPYSYIVIHKSTGSSVVHDLFTT